MNFLAMFFFEFLDNLIVEIGGANQGNFKVEEMVESLLSKKMRRKPMDSESMEAYFVGGDPQDRNNIT